MYTKKKETAEVSMSEKPNEMNRVWTKFYLLTAFLSLSLHSNTLFAVTMLTLLVTVAVAVDFASAANLMLLLMKRI